VKKRFIEIVWQQPDVPIKQRFDVDKFKISTEAGLVKVIDLEKKEPFVIFPAHRVQLIQFGEEEVESPILAPGPTEIPKDVIPKFIREVS